MLPAVTLLTFSAAPPPPICPDMYALIALCVGTTASESAVKNGSVLNSLIVADPPPSVTSPKLSSCSPAMLNASAFNIVQLDKHRTFLTQLSQLFANKYPDTLKTCYVYNASFVFSQIFNIVSLIVDKDTLTKIELIPPFKG